MTMKIGTARALKESVKAQRDIVNISGSLRATDASNFRTG